MIHKKMAYRNSSGATLKYVYRGDGHEHDVKESVFHIHAQAFAPSPIKRNKDGSVKEIDISPMEAEMDFLADKNQRSENRFAHYVISLPPGERLDHAQWKDVAKTYMRGMGYGLDTKWTAALHDEKDSQHIHIVACRIQNNPQGLERSAPKGKGNKPQPYPLVADSNDHARGMEIMREMERKYGLAPTISPDQTWGADLSREEFDGTINRYEKIGNAEAPWKMRILARLGKAVEKSKGKTFSEFLAGCRAVGVEPMVTLNDRGFPTGISYSMEDRSAAGAELKSTRLTFSALTGQKFDRATNSMQSTSKRNEGISYDQKRDISACHATAASPRGIESAGVNRLSSVQAEDGKQHRGRDQGCQMQAGRFSQRTMGAPLTRAEASKEISMNSRGGINELLNLYNFYVDLEMHAAHSRRMARLQWGR